jgi:hypothetical protein
VAALPAEERRVGVEKTHLPGGPLFNRRGWTTFRTALTATTAVGRGRTETRSEPRIAPIGSGSARTPTIGSEGEPRTAAIGSASERDFPTQTTTEPPSRTRRLGGGRKTSSLFTSMAKGSSASAGKSLGLLMIDRLGAELVRASPARSRREPSRLFRCRPASRRPGGRRRGPHVWAHRLAHPSCVRSDPGALAPGRRVRPSWRFGGVRVSSRRHSAGSCPPVARRSLAIREHHADSINATSSSLAGLGRVISA